MAAREVLGPERFLDVHHRDFVARPMATLERVYDWLGMPLNEELRLRFDAWAARNTTGAHGQHRYDPDDCGLPADAIRSDYGFYTSAFDIDLGLGA